MGGLIERGLIRKGGGVIRAFMQLHVHVAPSLQQTSIIICLNLHTGLKHLPLSHNSQVISEPSAAGW